jgi:hypothetical protein
LGQSAGLHCPAYRRKPDLFRDDSAVAVPESLTCFKFCFVSSPP